MVKFLPIHKKASLIALAAILVVGVFAVYVVREKGDREQQGAISLEEVQLTAAEFAAKEDIDGGLAYYDEQITGIKDSEDKQTMLILKSRFAVGAGRHEEAISAAKDAEALGSNTTTKRALADAYAASGDKAQALKYYRDIANTTAESSSDGGAQRGPSPDDIIRELEQ